MPSISNEGGKGDKRRTEDTAAVEANWDAIDWNAREEVPSVRGPTQDAAAEEE